MSDAMKLIQQGLTALRHNPGPVDGLWGAKTKAALLSLVNANGRDGRGAAVGPPVTDPPWMVEAKALLGRHEVTDNGFLSRWLKSDGKTLGDPAKLPWCGDFIETCIRLALPGEPLPGALGQNPYWARNWLFFGVKCDPTYGAVAVFERPGGGGHVAFLVGQSSTDFYVLGGNQSNKVSVTRISRGRALGFRWPSTHALPTTHLPPMNPGNMTLSTNEV